MISVKKRHIPFFSVIVTAYNRGHIIDRAITSLIGQSEKDWECIIVDDGSIDDTNAKAIEYVTKDDRFKYLVHSHRGQALTKNAGILAASGLFVTFLDSDDEYAEDHLSMRKAMLEEYPHIDILHGGVSIIGDHFVPDIQDPKRLIHLSECIIGGTFVVKSSVFHSLGGFPDVSYGDDTGFYEKALESGMNIAKTDHPSYIYHRDMSDSLCNSMRKRT